MRYGSLARVTPRTRAAYPAPRAANERS